MRTLRTFELIYIIAIIFISIIFLLLFNVQYRSRTKRDKEAKSNYIMVVITVIIIAFLSIGPVFCDNHQHINKRK